MLDVVVLLVVVEAGVARSMRRVDVVEVDFVWVSVYVMQECRRFGDVIVAVGLEIRRNSACAVGSGQEERAESQQLRN